MIPNKRLEDLLGLAPVDDVAEPTVEETNKVIDDNQQMLSAINVTIDKIDIALPLVRELETTDSELDDLADKAVSAFEDLQSLGLNVDPRFSGSIFQTAATMLGHAITAKQAKIDKKLRVIDLQLKKARLDMQKLNKAAPTGTGEDPIEGTGVELDRTELIKQILEQQRQQKDKDPTDSINNSNGD